MILHLTNNDNGLFHYQYTSVYNMFIYSPSHIIIPRCLLHIEVIISRLIIR